MKAHNSLKPESFLLCLMELLVVFCLFVFLEDDWGKNHVAWSRNVDIKKDIILVSTRGTLSYTLTHPSLRRGNQLLIHGSGGLCTHSNPPRARVRGAGAGGMILMKYC